METPVFRYILLLVLSAPLLYVAYRESTALLGLDRPRLPDETALAEQRQALQTLRDNAVRLGTPREDVEMALLAATYTCPALQPGAPKADVMLTPPLQAHALNLKDVRDLFLAFADLSKGDRDFVNPFPADHPYRVWVRRRQDLIALERKISKGLESYPRGVEALRKDLDDYERDPDRNVTFLKDSRGLMAWRDLGEPRPLSEKMKQALAPGSKVKLDELTRKIDDRTERLRQFLKAHPGGEYADRARTELATWQNNARLIDVMKSDSARSTRGVSAQLRKYTALLSKPDTPREFKDMVLQAAKNYCGRIVPRTLDRDTRVLVTDREVSVLRKRVRIKWKDSGQKIVYLSDSGYDEFDLPPDKVEYFLVGSETYEKPLRATARSKAVREYNKARGELRWTVKSLEGLQEVCKKHEASLRDQEAVLQGIVVVAPELFPPGE
jgi:hypothetical protein